MNMGVYIKGMEMPSEQYGKMLLTLYPNGSVAEYVGDIGRVWEAVPAADVVEVKHGRWIRSGQSFLYPHKFRNYSCSVCGYDIEKTKYNYCPNCGARMDGGEDNAVD